MIRIALEHCAAAVLAGLAIAMAGCSGRTEAEATTSHSAVAVPLVAAEAAASPSTEDASALVTPISLPEAAAEATKQSPAEAETSKPALAEYAPPFPDRVDLFVPPKRQGGVVLKEGGSEDAVELLGFVRLDKQQVVLSINGQLTRIAEGDSQYGIEVISIQPPKVVLQRGRQRWQASLEK